jgi:hypothetical protein
VIAPSSGESCVTLDDFALALSDSSKPDLRVKSLTLNPSTAAPGQAVQVKLSISNTGRAQAKQYRVSFYLGLTENDTSIVPFSTITVDGGTLGKRTSDVQASLVLPSRQSSGSFYVVAFVDSHGQVVESSEDNNVKGSCLRVRPSTGIKSVLFEATGPVDLELVDPDGRVLDAESMAASGVLYSYVDLDDDEIVDVELVIPEAVAGVYQVRTIPRPEAQSDDRVSLTAIEGGRATKLVPDSATIADLDPQGTEYLARPGGTAWLVLVPGLNFVSLALEPDPAAPRDVFDEMADLDIRHWDSSARKWATERNGLLSLLAPMQGYWVLASAETLIGVEGTPLSGEQSLALSKSGWQQVGVPYEVAWGASGGGTVRVEHAGETESLRGAMDRGWVSGAAWTWDGAAQEWVTLRADRGATLMPWIGYWLYTYIDDVTLRFSETPGGGVISMAAMEPRGGPPPVTVDAEAVAEPVDETLALLRVVSVPNPTGDETVFEVRGVCTCRVDGLRVTVYDLAGQQIWAGHSASAELPWDTRNELGEPLPNGMYLAVAVVRVDGKWESAPVWKLAVIR